MIYRLALFSLLFCFCLNAYGQKKMKFEDFDMHFYDAYLEIDDTTKVKFFLILDRENEKVTIVNGEERIKIDNIDMDGGNLIFDIPVFHSTIVAKFDSKNSFYNLEGRWNKFPGRGDYSMPFYAINSWSIFFPDRYVDDQIEHPDATVDMSGKWQVTFSAGTEDEYAAIGEFQQDGNKLAGTFRTATGDYRYLAGQVYEDKFKMSCFDGSHAFLFKGKVSEGNTINATFWSGNHWSEPWVATKNENASLPDPDLITFFTSGNDSINYTAQDMKGYRRTFSKEEHKGKVVIINIFGSWCPNCMDESRFLSQLYQDYKDKGLEIIGIAYERSEHFEEEMMKLKRYKQEMGIEYEILFAGKANKKKASQDFPMLNGISSFPTTIVLDKNGNVRKIHTGFSGPATSTYDGFVKEFTELIAGMCFVGSEEQNSKATETMSTDKPSKQLKVDPSKLDGLKKPETPISSPK